MSGKKYDQGKPRYDLIPPEAMRALAHQLTYGAEKYGDRNWEQGIHFGRLVRAATGHLWDWWAGEDKDEEGRPHLHGAITSLAMLLSLVERHEGTEWDDRPVKTSSAASSVSFGPIGSIITYDPVDWTGFSSSPVPPVESVENSAETDQSTGEYLHIHKRTLQRKILCTGESIEDAWDGIWPKRKHYQWHVVTCPKCLALRT